MTRKQKLNESPDSYYTVPDENKTAINIRQSFDSDIRQSTEKLLKTLDITVTKPKVTKVKTTLMKILYNYVDSVLTSYNNQDTISYNFIVNKARLQAIFAELSKQTKEFGYIIKLTKPVLRDFQRLVNDGISHIFVFEYPRVQFLDEKRFRYNDCIVTFSGLGERYRLYLHLRNA